jgi:hypothetical protein
MIASLRLLPLLIRRSPRASVAAMALCTAGVAIATLVGTALLIAQDGLDRREARQMWREPHAVDDSDATALVRRSTEVFSGERIDVVEVATTGAAVARPDLAPVAPGVAHLPGPGQAVVSPALATLLSRVPPDQLGDRFGQVVGTIGDDGLARPGEMVAMVGRSEGQLRTGSGIGPIDSGDRLPGTPSAVTPVAAFDHRGSDLLLQTYRELALVAAALVVVPAAMLVGSSARLTAARRERRLAALRLAGATPWGVRALAAAETALGALAGAVVGVTTAALVAPSLRVVGVAGGSWFPGDLAISPMLAATVVVGATAVSTVVATVSLRRVTAAPLGVARSSEPRNARWPRVLALLGSLVVMVGAAASASSGGSEVAVVAALAMVLASLALVGPWVTSMLGRLLGRLARRPSTLIAGRRISDDPSAAYRVVSAVVLAGIVAGFVAAVLPTAAALTRTDRTDRQLTVSIAPASVPELERLAGLSGSRVDVAAAGRLTGEPSELVRATIDLAPATSVEELRTATAPVRAGHPLLAPSDDLWGDATLVADVARGAVVVLVAALVLAAGASTVAAAASVLDQRRTLQRLVLAGVGVGTLHRSRRWQTTLPLVTATTGSIGLGLGCGVVLMAGFGVGLGRIAGPSIVQLVGVVALSLGIGVLGAAVTRPMLVAATRAPEPSTR